MTEGRVEVSTYGPKSRELLKNSKQAYLTPQPMSSTMYILGNTNYYDNTDT